MATKITYHGPPGMAIGALGVLIPGRTYEVDAEMAKTLCESRWFSLGRADAGKGEKRSKRPDATAPSDASPPGNEPAEPAETGTDTSNEGARQ